MEPPLEDSEDGGMCTYLVVSSPEKLLLNVTTPAITVLREILQVWVLFKVLFRCVVQGNILLKHLGKT